MRVWSFQSPEVYEKLMDSDIYHADMMRGIQDFASSYAWMKEQMKERLPKHSDPGDPVWVWYKWDGKNIRPDLRRTDFRYREHDMYLLELEIPDDEVLLSDFDTWHSILNDGIISDNEAELDWYFDKATPEEQERFKKDNWPLVFDVSESSYIQGCIWELKKEYVKSVKFCKKSTR